MFSPVGSMAQIIVQRVFVSLEFVISSSHSHFFLFLEKTFLPKFLHKQLIQNISLQKMVTIVFVRPLLVILVLLATILTAISLLTPGWRGNIGLVAKNCHSRERTEHEEMHRKGNRGCGDWWNNSPGWLRTVIAMMILAFLIEIIVLVWTGLAFLGVCLPRMYIPLAFLCALAALLLIISVIIFAAGDGRQIVGHAGHSHLGYSFWFAVLASIIMVLATIAAGGVAGMTKTII